MTTDIEHAESVQDTVATVEEPAVALEELLEFTRERVRGDMTLCPGCTLLVPINARRCQHCESNVEANNALVRETLRRIDEITGGLDNEGRTLDRAWRSIKNRMRRMFGRTVEITGIVSEDDAHRVLTGAHAGDQITLLETHGAWARVRTADGREGWVYSLSTTN
jgi:hypothetical protein